jgi:hypothetical protein
MLVFLNHDALIQNGCQGEGCIVVSIATAGSEKGEVFWYGSCQQI